MIDLDESSDSNSALSAVDGLIDGLVESSLDG